MLLYDFHSHILPLIDHGSSGVETTQKQIEIIRKSGVGAVVATPHFYPHVHSLEDFLEERESSLEQTEELFERNGLSLYLGAEVLLCEGLERMEGLSQLCIQGTNIMLVEMPFARWSDGLLKSLLEISKKGIAPIIAHIDRYNDSNIERLMSVLTPMLQLNAAAFCSFFSRKGYLRLIEQGHVYAIGSDLHGTKHYDDFKKAIRYIGEQNTKTIMDRTASLLKGAKVYGKRPIT